MTDVLERFDSRFDVLFEDFMGAMHPLDNRCSCRRPSCRCCSYGADWRGFEDNRLDGKALPYDSSWASFHQVLQIGHKLHREPVIRSATENMISYVISTGHSYTPSPRDGVEVSSRVEKYIADVKTGISWTKETVDLGSRRGWYPLQQETYLRKIKGEYFRRGIVSGDRLHVRFVEPFDVRTPGSWKSVLNLETVPELLRGLRTPPGELGVAFHPTDASLVLGYFVLIDEEKDLYWFYPRSEVQHGKMGVDSNDPRGIPLFYDVLCYVRMLRDVAKALVQLILVQSKYAAILIFDRGKRIGRIRALGDSMAETKEESGELAPGEVLAKGFEVELPGTRVRASTWVEVIQQLQRFIGNVAGLPEFMISGDANTGNRSSLVSAEGPFDRRVRREQTDMGTDDIDLLWLGVAAAHQWDEKRLSDVRQKVVINQDAPEAVSRDWFKVVEALLSLSDDTDREPVISRDAVRRKLDFDAEEMLQEIEKQTRSPRPQTQRPSNDPEPRRLGE